MVKKRRAYAHTRQARNRKVRDDARAFEEFMNEHNERIAHREAEEARAGEELNDAFAEGFLRKMRAALGVEE